MSARLALPTVESCDDCGACCMHMRSPPFVGSHVVDGNLVPAGANGSDPYGDHGRLMAAPEEARRILIDGIYDDRPHESPCSWFDQKTKRCRWWAHRPDVCRAYEVGGEDCLAARRERRISKNRFRMKNGRLVVAS